MAEVDIHPLALVESGASLGTGVRVGPFCHVGAQVVLGDGVELISHVSVSGATTIGERTKVFPHTALGGAPQNLRHKGGYSTLSIGRDCMIRECVTVNAGSDNSGGETRVGDNAYLMAYTHIAHDCHVGNNVTMANNASLSGHVEVGDYVNFGGFSGVHQFVRIGHHAFIAGAATVFGDVIPYGMAFGNRAWLRGLNVVGLKRSGVTRSDLTTIRAAYAELFSPDTPLMLNAEQARIRYASSPMAINIIDFVLNRGKRHLIVPKSGENGDGDAEDDG